MESKERRINREKVYRSAIANDAPRVAREYSFGLELAEYCTVWDMDAKLAIEWE